MDIIINGILYAIACIFFLIESAMGRILDILFDAFRVFAGVSPVQYNGQSNYLIDVFFSNKVISTIYWGMALIGIAMTFGFAIAAVIKKSFDSNGERMKATYGMILTNIFKSILLILLMTAIVSATITATGVLMTQIDYLFTNAEKIADPDEIYFDEEDYATMFRVLDTIGNHGLNPSYNNRFNINTCFNEIRRDMQSLEASNVFNYTYEGAEGSWQYMLREIYLSASIDEDIPVDVYNESVSDAILTCMEKLKTDGNFVPVSEYHRSTLRDNNEAQLGRTMMVAASMTAAKNNQYNKKASLTDTIRRPFYMGERDVYDMDEVEDFFSIEFGDWDHIVATLSLFILVVEFAKIVINCVGRIFNIILLYLTAPGFAAAMPLDDGGKMKQWTTAFVIQSLSIFGTFIAVRLVVIFIPIVLDPALVLFENSTADYIAKVAFVIGLCMTAQKASQMISGILADNAGYQSIIAGDVGSGVVSRALSYGSRAASAAAGVGLSVAGKTLSGAATVTGLSTVGKSISKEFGNIGQAMRDKGGLIGAMRNGFTTDAEDTKAKQDREKADEKRETQEYRQSMTSGMSKLTQGVGRLNSNMSSMNEGMGKMNQGMDNMNQSMGQMNQGMDSMNQGVTNVGNMMNQQMNGVPIPPPMPGAGGNNAAPGQTQANGPDPYKEVQDKAQKIHESYANKMNGQPAQGNNANPVNQPAGNNNANPVNHQPAQGNNANPVNQPAGNNNANPVNQPAGNNNANPVNHQPAQGNNVNPVNQQPVQGNNGNPVDQPAGNNNVNPVNHQPNQNEYVPIPPNDDPNPVPVNNQPQGVPVNNQPQPAQVNNPQQDAPVNNQPQGGNNQPQPNDAPVNNPPQGGNDQPTIAMDYNPPRVGFRLDPARHKAKTAPPRNRK